MLSKDGSWAFWSVFAAFRGGQYTRFGWWAGLEEELLRSLFIWVNRVFWTAGAQVLNLLLCTGAAGALGWAA